MAATTAGPDDAEERRRGRRHNAIHGFTAGAEWARLLRAELKRAGEPTRREMEKRTHYSASIFSAADSGRSLATWKHSEAYLRACDVPDEDLPAWQRRHAGYAAAETLRHPPLDHLRTRADVRPAVLQMLHGLGLDLTACAGRGLSVIPDCVPDAVPGPVPAAAELLDPQRFGERVLAWIVYLAGGYDTDVRYWVARWRDLPEPPAPPGPAGPPALAPPPARRTLALLLVGATAVVVGVVAGALYLSGHRGTAALAGRGSASPPPALGPAADAGPAGETLLGLADQAERAAAAPEARYRCVHRADWTVDATDPRARETRTDERLCWANDGPGRRLGTINGRDPHTERLAPGPPPGSPPAPGTDPQALYAAALDRRPKPDGDARPLLYCLDLADTYPLTPAQRGAVLRMLAARDGLVLRGQGFDRLGRAGLAISADGAAGKRVTLLLDQQTGDLLGAQVVTGVPLAAGQTNTEDVAYAESGWFAELPAADR
ncbi:hypothetical protein [Dactylosporangium matsuzakiense]|uniref:Helix-turn-helix protein n=1 Tax=Dactylosporangium matsuzakiense TaxID=53360 RepID=A0A9W6KEY3_9ACTN|nr:hypothetical protein [Dactylosporangium matsuzakiense]UWZ48945.1 hypothetical protein Dmats_22650 [Dactylosporangium matsuzakiense]GLL00826.1 hypothetical protein GCM10017581_025670 [Dactylosporangium matsuzakiense]